MSLIKVFKKLNKTNTKFDVIIHVGKEPNFKEFHADSKTLRKKSDYFDEILSIKDIEKKDEKHLIKKPNITPQIFDVIIKYLSKGKINLNNKTGNEILNIIIVSVDLKLNELIQIGENFLIKNHQKFLQYDSVEILQRVHHLNTFNKIQKFCLDMICFKPYILFNSDEFIHLPSSLLEIILKQDDLNLDEIEIWEILIKWGLSQDNNNILNDDISEWNREIFNNLERNLLGGYNPLDWNRFGWKNTSDSFIFSFGDYKNINTGKIGRINNNKFRGAVISDPEWGPIFGKYKKGRCDLSMNQNGDWSSYPNTYSNVNIPKNYFDIDDYEVFQVEKVNMFDLYVEDVDYKKE
ncbi:unnamed protein product [Rhizophagus irregularis]|nr:unnamed protein product [Rhizophagus irregularis]